MTEVAVNYLVEKLLELGRENFELITGVQDDVNDLVSDLQSFKEFLKDASSIDGETAQGWKQSLKEIRNVVYKAEDSIDKFLAEAKQHQDVHPAAKWIDVPHWIKVKNVAKEIQSIRARVKKVQDKYKHLFEAAQLNALPKTTPQPRQVTLSDEDDVVGFEEEANTVIHRLIKGSKNLQAVPIVGMPGLGKSTLAKKVYKDARITLEFFKCIWVDVTQSYKKTDVLLSILRSFTKQVDNKTDDQITDEIRNFLLKGGRCLIMLDDVWEGEVMNFIEKIFPKSDQGHRIMMTTRQDNVASAFNKDIHRLSLLSDANSWLLLKKKVFRKESCSGDLEEPGYSIAKKCNGLPLAIVVIAGALIGCKTKREWEHVNKNIGDHLLKSTSSRDSCLRFVKMSYDLLSYDTKACFLYCATFPRGFDIPTWKLIRLWISEGFIPFDKNLTPEEKAEDYLNDLTKKNLVMAMNWTADGQIKTCRIHDMLYEFCKKEASEEYLYQEITQAPGQSAVMMQDPDFYRRLCINSSNLNNFLSSFSKKPPMEIVRSFLCFTSEQTGKSCDHLKTIHKVFPLIKVLDLQSIKFSFTKDFYKLVHMRYISFSGEFTALPEPFGKFWNLETLIINTTTPESTFIIKADIWNMLRLRHLHTNAPAKLPLPGAPSEKESCIQTLSMISPQSCTKKIFSRARSLRKLGIRGSTVVSDLLASGAGGLSDLAELKRLEHLKLINDAQYTGKVITLPKMVFIFPKTLRKLTFSGTSLEWSEMSKLAQLESLEVLKLKEYAFKGEFWETETGGFSSLIVLWIQRTDLKTWRASKRIFSSLKRLFLISCDHLEEIPEVLADIPDLLEMKLENTHKVAVKAARAIEKKKKEKNKLESSIGFKLTVFPPDTDVSDPPPTH